MKNFRKTFFVFMLSLMTFSFTSCYKDENENNEPDTGVNNGKPGDAASFLNLTSVGEFKIYYDSQNRPEKLMSDWEEIIIDYVNGKILINDEGDEEVWDVKFDKNGLISELSIDKNSSLDGLGQKTILNYKDGYLIKGVTSEKTDGYSYDISFNNIWDKGNLTKITADYTQVEGKYKDTGKIDVSYKYSNVSNKYLQMPLSIGMYYPSVFAQIFPQLGLMGYGPKNLPSSLKYKDTWSEDGETGFDEFEENFKFALNDNGSIKSETFIDDEESWTYYYGYGKEGLNQNSKKGLKKLLKGFSKKGNKTYNR